MEMPDPKWALQTGRLDVVPMRDALALGPAVWDAVRAESGATSPFMSWAWHRAWAEAALRVGLASCRVVVLRSAAGQVEALFPFRCSRDRFRRVPVRAVGWAIGDLGCPDHLDLLASPEADLDRLAAALDGVPWEVIRLGNVAETAPSIERFVAACERRGWTVHRNPLWRCPYLELPETWEAYLSTLSASRRQTIRWSERKLRQQHAVVVREYGEAQIAEGWRHLERLHAQRWGEAGVLQDPATARLHRCFAAALASGGQLWLVTLDLDGAPAAAWYGFSFGDTVYYYQGGWDPMWQRHGIGMVLTGLMIRRAIERGYRRFDFLRGEEPYKATWTSTARQCREIVILRAGWRGAVLGGLDWIARRRPPK
jgi:CelD/BcsL family acetyltransferase involved in cellulose biosynthesis